MRLELFGQRASAWAKYAISTAGSLLGSSVQLDRAECLELDSGEADKLSNKFNLQSKYVRYIHIDAFDINVLYIIRMSPEKRIVDCGKH